MKRYLHKSLLLSASAERIPKEFFKEKRSWGSKSNTSSGILSVIYSRTKKFQVLLLFLFLTFPAIAPVRDPVLIYKPAAINPFEPLMEAIGTVETMGNTMAFNQFENAVGIFQIRQVKVDEYNRQTGNRFSLNDMFDYENSRKVFLHFASVAGPYNFEKIAKAWNGSGPMTDFYWQRIKSHLENIHLSGQFAKTTME